MMATIAFLEGLDARLAMGLANALSGIDELHAKSVDAWDRAITIAAATAKRLSSASPGASIDVPPMLQAEPELAMVFLDVVACSNDEFRRQQRLISTRTKVEAAKAGLLDWTELGVLSPESLVDVLLRGESYTANSHTVRFHGGVTWYTNPYGLDGYLCGTPSVEPLTRFLADMAMENDYGLTPC